MEAKLSSDTWVNFHQIVWRYTAEGSSEVQTANSECVQYLLHKYAYENSSADEAIREPVFALPPTNFAGCVGPPPNRTFSANPFHTLLPLSSATRRHCFSILGAK